MSDDDVTRRRVLQGLGTAGLAGLAGCRQATGDGSLGDATVRTETPHDDHGDRCPPVEYVLDTGYDQSAGGRLPPGETDDDWDVTGDEKNGPGSVPRDADVVGDSFWPAPFADSRWISFEPDRGRPLPAEDTQYEYTYCFCLNEGFREPELALKLQADDRVEDIRLNGTSLPFAGTGNFQGAPIEETYTNRRYFQPGENCLTVVVRDTAQVISGLNLVGRMRAKNADCDCGCGGCDLSVEKRHEGQFAFGETGTYVVEVCNGGDGDCTRAAVVEDELPDGVTFVSASGNGWQASANGGAITATHANPGGLAPGECLPPLTVEVELVPVDEFPADSELLRNCADLLGSDQDAANDTNCNEIRCLEGERVLQGGDEDGFAGGTEPASPGDGLVARADGNLRDFDEGGINKHFGHTFGDLRPSPLAGEICEATLEICLRPEGELDANDVFSLGAWDDEGQSVGTHWARKLGNHDGQPGLFDTRWATSETDVRCITLDLAELPEADGSTTDLLPVLNTHDRLDVYVQDDTAVDFARLTVRYCCGDDHDDCQLSIEKTTRGEFHYGRRGRYAVRVCNESEERCSTPVEVRDDLPDGMRFRGVLGSGWSATANGGAVTATHPNPGGLAPGECLPPLVVEVDVAGVDEYPGGDAARNCAQLVEDDAVADEDCVRHEIRRRRG